MNINNCLICKKHNDNINAVYQNEILYLSHYVPHPDGDENYPGYYFIESKRHFKGIYDATVEEISEIGITLRKLSRALISVPRINHVYCLVIGEGIDHFHIHVIGRYENTPVEYYGTRVMEWPDAPRGDIHQILKLNEYIKGRLMF